MHYCDELLITKLHKNCFFRNINKLILVTHCGPKAAQLLSFYLRNTMIKVRPAVSSDMPVIEQLAKGFDLDCDDLSVNQFAVAVRDGNILGFGRIREYPGCAEIATVGVIPEEQKKGFGSLVVNELIRIGPPQLFVTCVIPAFFSKFGFESVKQYPSVLRKKVDFCSSYGFCEEDIFVMSLKK